MLLSIKSIVALSIVPLSFARHHLEKVVQDDFCNIVGTFNRIVIFNGNVTESQLADTVQYNLTPYSNYCPTIQGQVGTPVCQAQLASNQIPSSTLLAQNNTSSNLAPVNENANDTNMFRWVTYYPSIENPLFPCNNGYSPVCRYCGLQDYAPELSRNFVYTQDDTTGTLFANDVLPFRCGAPKCPAFATVPGSNPTKYVRLSAAYCVSNGPISPNLKTPYAFLLENYACGAGLNQAAVNQRWGCYIETNPSTLYPGSTNGTWCDVGFTPTCYYDVSKPYSYPPILAP